MTTICSVDGCETPMAARGWCQVHYSRAKRYGDPLGGGPPVPKGNPHGRFWSRVNKTEDCWLWTGNTNTYGYGQFCVDGRNIGAHRYSYEEEVGPIPEGLQIDHLCRVRHCVNPAHMEPVTRRENLLRGESFSAREARQTHCLRGHPFDEINTHREPGRPSVRVCRECRRNRRAYTSANKVARAAAGVTW